MGNEYYKRITTEILDYVVREMTDPNGGFYSSQDADSERHQGKFFVGTPDEIRSVLGGSASGLLIVSRTRQDTSDVGDGASHARSATKRLMSAESRGSGKQTNDSRGNV